MPSAVQRKNARILDKQKGKVVHPDSRRVKQLRRTLRHNLKADNVKTKLRQQRSALGARFEWFKDSITKTCGIGAPTEAIVAALAELFIHRHDAEIEKLKQERNPPRGKIKMLQEGVALEESMLTSSKGLQFPWVTNPDVLELVMKWDGDEETVPRIKTAAVSRMQRSAEQKKEIEGLVDKFRPVLFPETEVALGRQGVASRAGAAVAKAVEVKNEKQSAKVSLGSVRSELASGRRAVAQKQQAALRRHKQLAMSRGLLN